MDIDKTMKNIGNLIVKIIGLHKISHVLSGVKNTVRIKILLDIVFY
jgi:hypothetical protein